MKVRLVKAMVFPVVLYGCECWAIKKAECWRVYAFELWRWRRLLRVPWTSRRSNHSILKEISPEDSLEGLMQKLQYFGHKLTHLKRPWCWATLEGKEDSRGWDGLHHRLNGHEFEQAPEVGDGQGSLACCSPWGRRVQTRLSDWIERPTLGWM